MPLGQGKALARFFDAGEVCQHANAAHVPPLRFDLRRRFDAAANPWLQRNEAALFVAEDRGGAPVGRIAALLDRDLAAREGLGAFGFLHASDDPAIVALLLAQARTWLAARGVAAFRGPLEFSINHDCGLLVDGFDAPTYVDTPGSAPWLGPHLEACGLQAETDLLGWELDPAEALACAPKPQPGKIRLRALSRSATQTDVQQINRIYNDAWRGNRHAQAMPDDEASFIFALMRPLLRPGWIAIAELDAAPVGVVAMLPDLHWMIRDLGGRLAPFGWARLLWRLHAASPERARLPLIGVVPALRRSPEGHRAADLLLRHALNEAVRAGVRRVEVSWVLDGNAPLERRLKALGAQPSRRWRLYRGSVAGG